LLPIGVSAAENTPAAAAEIVRSTLLQAQLDVTRDPQAAQTLLTTAQSAYDATLATTIRATAPPASEQIDGAWNDAAAALQAQDSPAFAAARAHIWTGILAGSYRVVENALASNDSATAQQWLPVREFRVATRFSRPAADATLAVDGVRAGTLAPADGVLALKAELLDTYQARLNEALNTLRIADEKIIPANVLKQAHWPMAISRFWPHRIVNSAVQWRMRRWRTSRTSNKQHVRARTYQPPSARSKNRSKVFGLHH